MVVSLFLAVIGDSMEASTGSAAAQMNYELAAPPSRPWYSAANAPNFDLASPTLQHMQGQAPPGSAGKS